MKKFALVILSLIAALTSVAAKPLADEHLKGSFAWGAEAGGSVDMTGHDMSAVDIGAFFGYKRGWINFAGAGVSVEFPVSSSSRFYNFFADFRTNFRNEPSLIFVLLRGGVTESYLSNNEHHTGFYGSGGIGINLARSSKFTSYISMAYTYSGRKHILENATTEKNKHISAVTFKIGICF